MHIGYLDAGSSSFLASALMGGVVVGVIVGIVITTRLLKVALRRRPDTDA